MKNGFSECKIAYIYEGRILVYKRYNNINIPYAGLWDLPGGGRDGKESPEQCMLRELEEEFSISLDVSRLIYKRKYAGKNTTFFYAAYGEQAEVDGIVFGPEGQCWEFRLYKSS
ncbi:NUDIX domain-containing protein [Marinobacter sp. EVN1]|uniref:NUDIX domain-containing protein n=1 Tax=Marinobacter sp. EVN1 TaxID=1397532 RepID=UPI0009DC17BE|nr:NUDIX domain-containing protein [Marinobacter sp. EVN1]